MTQGLSSKRSLGVWLEWPEGDASNAGALARRVAFLVLGAAISGEWTLHVAVANDALAGVVQARLTEIAGDEGAHWVLHTPERLLAERQYEADQRRIELQAAYDALNARAVALSMPEPRGRKDLLMPWRYGRRELTRQTDLTEARSQKAEMDAQRHQAEKLVRVAGSSLPPVEFAAAMAELTDVEGWLVMAPDFSAAQSLPGPKAILVGDGTPAAWPLGWPDQDWLPGGPAAAWRARTAALLAQGDSVIVASQALADSHALASVLNVSRDRIHVVPGAAVDLSHVLNVQNRRALADRLRAELANADNGYLRNFAFEDSPYVVAWSEGRPGLNLRVAAQALKLLVQRDLKPIKIFIASPGGSPEPEVWHEVRAQGLHHDFVSMPALSTPGLAALLGGATLSLFTAPSSDGSALIAWSQALSLGAPSLLCDGPDAREIQSLAPIGNALFEPYDSEGLAQLIKFAVEHRDSLAETQRAGCRELDRTWKSVLDDYLSVLGLQSGN
jgi:glycosyltransferase involved in cell wall biosynthesis